jgi:tRNA nucleotidyltransferase (CCA-adding enzyme)
LTYASTTPRDIRAAAALVEAGASLRIAADFLNPALSEAQKKLYDTVLPNVITKNIHGKVILIATADASNMNEEISSIAHKLRDLLDPDGLFLLAKTNEGIRIVARSTSDQINVAKVMSEFGGGGHERAASALIDTHSSLYPHGEDPLNVLSETLEHVLQEAIQPSITVGKIMSKKPLLLTPETTLEEAARACSVTATKVFRSSHPGKLLAC